MPYEPHIQIVYRLAEPGEIPDGHAVWIKELPGRRAAMIFEPDGVTDPQLLEQATLQSASQMVNGEWRQDWTGGDRMEGPTLGKLLCVSRWEAVPPEELPEGCLIHPISRRGSCVWAVSWDSHAPRIRHGVNDQLLRLAGDGLWKQHWPGNRLVMPTQRLAPPIAPLILA
ncbi:hypothetical protein OG866_26925 [Streptomyces sp. NBC_00663]|uniref:hypothetical protein n=1 Tax=Streptomyces sp. NBC_00663 TaxID=2975801 RepID=UPI002E323976|nr:hypothetical protein [Streptomyces sp. NBC_00663]